jgi:fructose-1-phosphate kinase PfkB-like protein
MGCKVTAYGLIGGEEQAEFESELNSAGVRPRTVAIQERTRRNLTLLGLDGKRSRHFRAHSWRSVPQSVIQALLRTVDEDTEPGDMVSVHGAIPSSVSSEIWLKYGEQCVNRHATIAADIYGKDLDLLTRSLPLKYCKPNLPEAKDFASSAGLQDASVEQVLRELTRRGVQFPFVSCGSQGVAFLLEGELHLARSAVRVAVVEVGAGDESTAAALVELEHSEHPTIRKIAVRMASSAARYVGGGEEPGDTMIVPA